MSPTVTGMARRAMLVLILVAVGAAVPTAATAAVTTSWLGNSLPGGQPGVAGSEWMQNTVSAMAVDRDGTIFTNSHWDEGGAEAGVYREGRMVGRLETTHGWSRGGGAAIAIDSRHVYMAMTQGPEDGAARFLPGGAEWFMVRRYDKKTFAPVPLRGGAGYDRSMRPISKKSEVVGLTVGPGVVFAATADGVIRVLRRSDLKPLRQFRVPGARALAWDGRALRVVAGSVVRRVTANGTAISAITGAGRPTALAFDSQGDLLVADGGPAAVVRRYRGRRQVSTFGVPGGMAGGGPALRGTPGPTRFSGLSGVGVDASGRLYTAMTVVPPNAKGVVRAGAGVVRSFAPDGALRWELLGLVFTDTASVAGESGSVLDVYTSRDRFRVDLSQPVGRQWTWVASTLDAAANPRDPRLGNNFPGIAPRMVTLAGRRFMAVTGMYAGSIDIYRFEGEVAVFSTSIPAGDGGWARDVADDGTLWTAEEGEGPITRWGFAGLDARGNPRWTRTAVARPEEFEQLGRLLYDPANDSMIVTGFTASHPNPDNTWGVAGREAIRYDDWSTQRKIRWRIVLPWDRRGEDPARHSFVKAIAAAGDSFFTAEGSSARIARYDRRTGQLRESWLPGAVVGAWSGWVDFPAAMTAHARPDGSTVVLVEENGNGKVLLYHVAPDG